MIGRDEGIFVFEFKEIHAKVPHKLKTHVGVPHDKHEFYDYFYPFLHDFLCSKLVLNTNYGYFTKFSVFAEIS